MNHYRDFAESVRDNFSEPVREVTTEEAGLLNTTVSDHAEIPVKAQVNSNEWRCVSCKVEEYENERCRSVL